MVCRIDQSKSNQTSNRENACDSPIISGEDILVAMLTLGFDSYVEPLRTFLTKIRDASKYDRTMTMGGELPDDLRRQVAQVQSNQPATSTTSNSMAQAQVATKIQVQPQSTTPSVTINNQPINSKTNPNSANPNGLEPYGHSVRHLSFERKQTSPETELRFHSIFDFRCASLLAFETISPVKIQTMSTRSNRINDRTRLRREMVNQRPKRICK